MLRSLCANEAYRAWRISRRIVIALLRFLLSTLILDMKHDATDRFMRDTIGSSLQFAAVPSALPHAAQLSATGQQEYHSSDISALVVVA